MDSIIQQATTFRDFLSSFTNAACTTTEEVPTLIFYLRKIEGAEVLLAYETNFFRQEIHKWAPIAPEAPPILEQSLSTRKPRPTKQQKMMAQLGVERPEDLPPHLRAKSHQLAKRKSLDSPISRPPLQPLTSNSPEESRNRRHSGDPTSSQPFPFAGGYGLSRGETSPEFNTGPSSAFLPHAASHSPFSRSPSSPNQGLDQPLFSAPAAFSRGQRDDPSAMDVDSSNPFASSSPRQNIDEVFADLTNQEPDADETMENTHATEALEALDAGNNSDRAASADGETNAATEGARANIAGDADQDMTEDF